MSHLTLQLTLIFIVTVHLADANYCEGYYTTKKEDVIQGIDSDISCKGPFKNTYRIVKEIILNGAWFKDICQKATRDEKLSICMKVLQHRLRMFRPVSFTVNATESNLECQPTRSYTRDNFGVRQDYEQRMYACPKTTVKYRRVDNSEGSGEEPPFSIGQGLHSTQYRVRFTDNTSRSDPPLILGQLTGFDLKAVLKFETTAEGHYTYKPDYVDSDGLELVCAVVPFRQYGDINEFVFEFEEVQQQ